MTKKDLHPLISEIDLVPFVQPKFLSIGWRFLIYFLLVSLLPVFIFGYSIISKSQFELKNQIQTKVESIAILKNSELKFWMDSNINEFQGIFNGRAGMKLLIEQMITEKSNQNRDLLRSEMEQILKSKHFTELFFVDPDSGKVLVSTNTISEGLDVSHKDFFIQGSKDFFESKVYYSEDLLDNALTISMPIKNKDEKLLGVFGAHIDLKVLYNFLTEKSGLGTTGEIYMVDHSYNRIPAFNYNVPYLNQGNISAIKLGSKDKLINTEAVINAFHGESGVGMYKNYDNKDVIGYFQFLPDIGLVFLVEQGADEALAPISSMKNTLFVVFLIILFADVAFAFIVANKINKPLEGLIYNAKQVQEGDYKVFSDIESNDEFGLLANALNKMAESLVISLTETKNIINTMPNALFILDVNGKIKSANQAALDLTDFGKENIVGIEFKELTRLQQGVIGKSKFFDLSQIIKEEVVTDIQLNCFTNSHLTIPISLSGTVLRDKDKKLTGFIIIAQDLRNLKEYAKERLQKITPLLHKISLGDFSEKFEIPSNEDEFTELLVSLDMMADNLRILMKENQLKTSQIKKSKEKTEEEKAKAEALLGSIGVGIIAIDLEGEIMLMNPEAENMFQKKFKDVLGKICCDVINFEDNKHKRILFGSYPISEVIASKKQIHTITYFINGNSEKLPLSTTFSPILFENKIFGVIGTFRDITKEMEVDRAKSEFVSLASHQLRTPLAGINWLLQEIQRKGNLDDLQTEYLHDALKSNERMVRLVNDLLNVSRLETGIININYTEVDFMDFVEDFVKEARIIAKTKNQTIEFDKPADEIKIFMDKDLIGQVITNLLSNAMAYTDKNKIIKVIILKNKEHVEISVNDQGIGISMDDQEKLFTKFYRTQEAAKYSTTGSGLGLYIVKKILDICCGKIQCNSEKGKGTTFTIFLPIKCPISKKGVKDIIKRGLI